MSQKNIKVGFILAGLMNFSVLFFSKFFTNDALNDFDTIVLSNFGILMIVVWGVAYISVAEVYQNIKWLVGVFAVEKFIYGFMWAKWHLNNNVSVVFDEDLLAGVFYSVYGVNDWLFCVFFSFVFIKLIQK